MNNPWAEIEKPTTDFNVRLVAESHPLKLYWGRDSEGRLLFVYESAPENVPDKRSLPTLTGIGTGVSIRDDSARLVLLLRQKENWELFHALCSDLVRATSIIPAGPAAGSVVLRRLIRWQEFLQKARPRTLSIEAIKGLIGELLFLSKKVAPNFGWDDAVSFWKGPEGAPQDFAIHQIAVEVKCQAGSTKPFVRISSLEQLDPQLPEGYLVVYTISTTDDDDSEGFSLNGLVERIREDLQSCSAEARERFEDLLYQSDYVTTEFYDEPRFAAVSVRSFTIDEEFPRLTPSGVAPGIDDVKYRLSLEACSPHEARPEWWEE